MIYNYETLPTADNLNRFSYGIEVRKPMFIQKGKMIAYYGSLKFEALGSHLLDILVKEAFNAPLYINNYVVVTGSGKLILGDNGNDVASYDLEDAHLTVKNSHVLGFDSTLTCQESTLPGYLTFLGNGRFIASSNGPVYFMEPPARVDEEALLGWADTPSPSYHYDYQHVRGVLTATGGLTGITLSGEEKQVDFTGKGTILVQSSEAGLMGRSTLQSVMAQISGLTHYELQQLGSAITTRLNQS
jgi:uncharacterized protein (AIM24 family)